MSKDICGDFKAVNIAFEKPNPFRGKKEILTTIARYKKITSTWAGYKNENTDWNDYEDYFEPANLPVRAEPKIGRNQPCPCGSGKKSKKCCG